MRVFKTQNDPAPYQNSMLPLTAKEIGVLKLADGNYVYRHGPDVFIAADGFVGAKKLVAFVKKALAENADARHVFFLTHLPVLPVAGGNPLWRLPAADENSFRKRATRRAMSSLWFLRAGILMSMTLRR